MHQQKPDENAPERPPSAYVIFSNQVRELLKGQDLSFTEIAKVVGERWQVLPAEEREACERQANSAKERYYAGLAEYKKTQQYEAYQNTWKNSEQSTMHQQKPDENAPERPPSAYVIFSNQVRELLKGQDLSFTEIAKVVGERWQVLPAEEREACERQANSAKERYYAGLAEYKKTQQYEAYQKYLEEFRAKHNAPTKA